MVNICWPHGGLKSVEISILRVLLTTCSSSGWILMTNIFLNFKNMNHQLLNALSTMLLRGLVLFIYFQTYVFENTQKTAFSGKSDTPKASFWWFWENDVNSSKEKIAIKALIMTRKLDSWPKWSIYSISKPQRLLKAYFGLGLNDLLHTCFQKIENFQCPSK